MRPGHIPRVEACDPSPAGGGEVDEDCTMASPVHVCRAVCEGVSLLGGRLFYNMPITHWLVLYSYVNTTGSGGTSHVGTYHKAHTLYSNSL